MGSRRDLSDRGLESLVISRAPLLVSFGVVGPTPKTQRRLTNQVVSLAIDYHVYTIIAPNRSEGMRMICGGQDVLSSFVTASEPVPGDAMALPHAISKHFDVRDGLSVFLAPPVAPGLGLGMLGSLAVTMIKGLSYFFGIDMEPKDVVELACHIGTRDLGYPAHSHYQYAAAYGGISSSSVRANRISYAPLQVSAVTHQALEQGLMLFCTGGPQVAWPHSVSEPVAGPEGRTDVRHLEVFHSLASKLSTALGDGDLERFGDLLHRLWLTRARLDGRSGDSPVDLAYEVARKHGALGGHGRSGDDAAYLVFYCPKANQAAVEEALLPMGWQRWPLMLTGTGVQVFDMMSWQPQGLSSDAPWRRFSIPEGVAPPR